MRTFRLVVAFAVLVPACWLIACTGSQPEAEASWETHTTGSSGGGETE